MSKRTSLWIFSLILFAACFVKAQTAVVLAPLPQLQFFDQTGTPLAFGCVFTYQVNSTTPLGTYTDYTGVTLNANPVILTAGGSANIWLAAGQAYTFRVVSAGGTNCASGGTLYTVNGIGGGSTTLTTVVPYSSTPAFQVAAQNQLFEITLTGNASAQPLTFVGITPPSYITFQITQDSSGGHTWSWPANSIGGCTIGSGANQVTTQQFVYNGTNATAVGPCVTGNGPIISAGAIYDFGLASPPAIVCVDANFQLNTGCSTGALTSITVNGQTIAAGGSGNVNAGAAAHSIALNQGNGDAITGLLLANNQVAIGQTSANPVGSTLPTCGSNAFFTFSGTLPVTCAAPVAVQASTITTLATNVTVSGLTTVLTKAVTMPASGCPCRAFISYSYYVNAGSHGVGQAYVSDGSVTMATTQVNIYNDGNTDGREGSSFSPATYANGASVTFTLSFNPATGGTWTVDAANIGPVAQNTWLNVAIFTSN